MQKLITSIGIATLALVLVACSASIDINTENGELIVQTDFSLSEDLLNQGGSSSLEFENTDFIRNAEFDIQDGQMVVNGDVLCEDNSRANGSVTIEMGTTETGFINVEITDVSADCEIDQDLIDRAQTELADGLAEAARDLEDSDATVTFTEVTLANDELTIALEVRAPFNND